MHLCDHKNTKDFINNINENNTKQCDDPRHFPPPLYISIPPGHVYKYKCPTCDHITELHEMDIRC